MTFWCNRCETYGHAAEWHTFKYRRWWVKVQRDVKGGMLNLEKLLVELEASSET